MQAWFPRALDRETGGFRTDFDRRWRATGPDDRMLEYQARQTRCVARLGRAFPSEPRWSEYARHGVAYIDGEMHDDAYGGWFWLVSADGAPLAGGTKHAHSTAYVIGAFAEAHRLTGDQHALDLARAAFEWLDETLHDADHGGYFGWATRDGHPIMRREQVAHLGRSVDPLGHEIGLKDLNVHSDLLESLRVLNDVSPSQTVGARAREIYDIIERHFTTPTGRMHYLLEADLTPFDGPEHPGYAFQCAYRMPLIAALAREPFASALEWADRVVTHALASGRDSTGRGFIERKSPPSARTRAWWVQTEAIQALVLLAVNGVGGSYVGEIDDLVALVESEILDDRYLGWYPVPRSDWSVVDRVRTARPPKAHRWKDASHETDMSLSAIRMLRGLGPDVPIRSGSAEIDQLQS
jgi:mannobiose 2-epimerase